MECSSKSCTPFLFTLFSPDTFETEIALIDGTNHNDSQLIASNIYKNNRLLCLHYAAKHDAKHTRYLCDVRNFH